MNGIATNIFEPIFVLNSFECTSVNRITDYGISTFNYFFKQQSHYVVQASLELACLSILKAAGDSRPAAPRPALRLILRGTTKQFSTVAEPFTFPLANA